MSLTPKPVPRTSFIDFIRVVLSVQVVMVHAAITYGGPGGWYLHEIQPDPHNPMAHPELVLFLGISQAFFMGFFFLLAGYFTPDAFDRKGPWKFLKDRLIRLGIPLLVYGYFLGPLTAGLAGIPDGIAFWGNFTKRLSRGEFNHGPLWFAQALLMFSVGYFAFRLVISGSKTQGGMFPGPIRILQSILLVGAGAFVLRYFFHLGDDFWGMQLGYFSSYLLLFPFGCWARQNRLLESIGPKIALPWMVVSLVSIPLLPLGLVFVTGTDGINGGANAAALLYAFWEPFVAWGIILGMLWLCRLFAGTRWGNLIQVRESIEWLGRNSYGMYIVHAPVLVGVSVLFWGVVMEPVPKILMVSALATGISFGISALLVRVPGVGKVI